MQIDVLGPLRLRGPAGPVDVGGPQYRAALTWLAVRLNERITPDAMSDVVWVRPPADAPRRLRAILRTVAHAMPAGALEIGSTVRLVLPVDAVDGNRFTAAIGDAFRFWHHRDLDRARRAVAIALDLWRGVPCPDISHTTAGATVIRSYDDARAAAFALGQEIALAGAVDFTVVADLRFQADLYPDQAIFRRQLARGLARTGRHVEALRVLREMAGGPEAEPASTDLATAILRQDESAIAAPDPDCQYVPGANIDG